MDDSKPSRPTALQWVDFVGSSLWLIVGCYLVWSVLLTSHGWQTFDKTVALIERAVEVEARGHAADMAYASSLVRLAEAYEANVLESGLARLGASSTSSTLEAQ